jgi:hypothetical protein
MSDEAETNDFAAFEQKANSGEVLEVVEEKVVEPAVEQEEPEVIAEGDDRGEDPDLDKDEEEKLEKPRKQPSDRIKELNSRLRSEQREKAELLSRLEKIEKGLAEPKINDNSSDIGNRPDPNDLDKYPLGALDDRYIEDMIEHVSDAKAAKALESVLQREQERAQQAEAEKQLTELRTKAETLVSRGTDLHDDFEETVYEAGLRGDWDLTQTTFEAAAEAEHGAEILYALATDPKEAHRVATLSPYQQIKFVMDRNAEMSGAPVARKVPGAPAPPQSNIRGSGMKNAFNPATADFVTFEKMANARK